MGKEKLQLPPFRSGSYSERANRLFRHDDGWQRQEKQSGSGMQQFARAIRWERRPDQYLIEQHAIQPNFTIRRPALQHTLFHVALMSAAHSVDRMRELDQWYIIQSDTSPEKIYYCEKVIDIPRAEKTMTAIGRNIDVTHHHDVYAANKAALSRLAIILEQGFMDGYERIRPQS